MSKKLQRESASGGNDLAKGDGLDALVSNVAARLTRVKSNARSRRPGRLFFGVMAIATVLVAAGWFCWWATGGDLAKLGSPRQWRLVESVFAK